MLNPRHLKKIDMLVGGLASYLANYCFRNSKLSDVGSILIIRPGGIGDAVLLLPMLNALSSQFPAVKIEVLAERRNSEVFSWCPQIYRTWHYDRPLELLQVLGRKYDLVIDTEQWYRLSAVVARLTRSPRIIGFAGNGRESLLTDAICYDLNRYEADMFRMLLHPLDVIETDLKTLSRPALPLECLSLAEELLPSCKYPDFIAIFPGASVPEKVWPIERFRSVVKFIISMGYSPVIIGSKAEYNIGMEIVAGLGGVVIAGKCQLGVTAAIVSRAAAFVTGDSGVLHIAAAFKIPTVALFGPSDWRKWGPHGDRIRVVAAECNCSPCSKYGLIPVCKHHKCMVTISVERVNSALNVLLKNR